MLRPSAGAWRQKVGSALHACVKTTAAGKVPTRAGPEFFQFGGFVTILITPVQFNFDRLDLILRRHRLPVIDIGGIPSRVWVSGFIP